MASPPPSNWYKPGVSEEDTVIPRAIAEEGEEEEKPTGAAAVPTLDLMRAEKEDVPDWHPQRRHSDAMVIRVWRDKQAARQKKKDALKAKMTKVKMRAEAKMKQQFEVDQMAALPAGEAGGVGGLGGADGAELWGAQLVCALERIPPAVARVRTRKARDQ